MLTALVNACKLATFGLAGNDILDENYREATKLDASAFSKILIVTIAISSSLLNRSLFPIWRSSHWR